MIRLDHHTSPLSPNPKQSPEHKIIPWDDAHFTVTDAVELQQSLVDANGDEKHQPLNPVSIPSPPGGGNATSPNNERSSSLSPVPPLAEEKEADIDVHKREEEEEDEAAQNEQSSPRVEKADESRLSPLSELSAPSDQEEDPSGEGDANGGNADTVETSAETEKPPPSGSEEKPNEQSQSEAPSQPNTQPSPFATPAPMTPTISTSIPSSTNPSQDPKVTTLLELNVDLFNLCMQLQSKNVPNSDPRYQQYSTRLQSNLTWLATVAEQNQQQGVRTLERTWPPTNASLGHTPPNIGSTLLNPPDRRHPSRRSNTKTLQQAWFTFR
ncbi:hypothetical protein BDN70DRAFT_624987 [Pholiota conissans]|uniref:Uncharacterized protein n=1 Tax=Pholiota conissans TaxID=109636 RepID=A0A9P5Z3Z4_9AGAR|nr:hypothetical protein BDN70DRAFT_624987 [Pholiota conissans]